jgi:hypothetical protein
MLHLRQTRRPRTRVCVRLLLALLAAVAIAGTGSGTAQPADTADIQPILVPGETVPAAPAPIPVDVTSLVPATVELSIPALCGDVTVYDQEDLGTLCGPTALAATPIVSPTCPQVVSGSVRLETDLNCTNTDGLIVGSDNTVIDLNGHTIRCKGVGFMGSCQGTGPSGVRTGGFDNVHVFSHLRGGTIDGFAQDVFVQTGSNNVKVKELVLTGPAAPGGAGRPFNSSGVLVSGTDCTDGTVRIGGGTKTGNEILNNNVGIQVQFSQCVYLGENNIHDNNGTGHPFQSDGIVVGFTSSDIHVRSNIATRNGRNGAVDAGLIMAQGVTDSLVVENQFNRNSGDGISTFFAVNGNNIVNNQMLFNSPPPAHHDAASDPGSVNTWNDNNRCQTQTTPQPPPGVCNPGEVPPPQ